MLLHILCSIMMMVSAIMCAPGQGRDNAMRLVRDVETINHSNSNRIILDPIGGGPLLGSVNSYMERQGLRTLDGGERKENMGRLARDDKSNNRTYTTNPNRITLDPIGGGNLLGSIDSYMERQGLRIMDGGEGRENMVRLARDGRSKTHTRTTRKPIRGTLDSLGKGHILRIVDSYTGGQVHRSLDRNHAVDSLDDGEGRENMVRLARDGRSNTHTRTTRKPIRGTLDSLGKGHILRIVDSHTGGQVHRSLDRNDVLDSLDGGEGRENMMRRARDDKLNYHHGKSNSMHAIVDPLGGGNLLKSRDSYTNEDKSNNQQDTTNSMHTIVDPLGGGNLVRSRNWYTRGDKVENHRTLDHLGGGGILRSLD